MIFAYPQLNNLQDLVFFRLTTQLQLPPTSTPINFFKALKTLQKSPKPLKPFFENGKTSAKCWGTYHGQAQWKTSQANKIYIPTFIFLIFIWVYVSSPSNVTIFIVVVNFGALSFFQQNHDLYNEFLNGKKCFTMLSCQKIGLKNLGISNNWWWSQI